MAKKKSTALATESVQLPKFANIVELKTWLRANPAVQIEQADIAAEKKRIHDLPNGKMK